MIGLFIKGDRHEKSIHFWAARVRFGFRRQG